MRTIKRLIAPWCRLLLQQTTFRTGNTSLINTYETFKAGRPRAYHWGHPSHRIVNLISPFMNFVGADAGGVALVGRGGLEEELVAPPLARLSFANRLQAPEKMFFL